MSVDKYCYIAKSKCGCITGVVTDMGDKDTAKDVADFIKSGRTISRMTIAEFQRHHFGCIHKEKP
jgi:hypothetical protein